MASQWVWLCTILNQTGYIISCFLQKPSYQNWKNALGMKKTERMSDINGLYELFTYMNRGGSEVVWIMEGPLYLLMEHQSIPLASLCMCNFKGLVVRPLQWICNNTRLNNCMHEIFNYMNIFSHSWFQWQFDGQSIEEGVHEHLLELVILTQQDWLAVSYHCKTYTVHLFSQHQVTHKYTCTGTPQLCSCLSQQYFILAAIQCHPDNRSLGWCQHKNIHLHSFGHHVFTVNLQVKYNCIYTAKKDLLLLFFTRVATVDTVCMERY